MTLDNKDFEMIEALDEQQIANELKGHVIEQYFYEFGSTIGISWAGIKYVARQLAEAGHPVSIEDCQVTTTNEGYTVIATAQDLFTKEKRFGASSQSKTMKLKDNTEKDDPFALQKAMSKAQRNAIRHFIPEIAIQEGYKAWKNRGKEPELKKTYTENSKWEPVK